eukprot:GEMP01031456.1.p1 GENE.GEMP01031456.1~~GEMP01031456.1.p1  ORF type:complete len:472 (+),score=95.01 GEMP01031456.1:68-1483(+)
MDTNEIIEKIKNYIYPRRPRIKEYFVDYDPLRSGTVSLPRFVRAVSCLGNVATPEELEFIAHSFERRNGDIDYVQFCAVVDLVFGPTNLEKDPNSPVPSPGATVPETFTPGMVEDVDRLHAIMHRISLLAQTRGVVFKYSFQDFDRADSASLTVPRRSGKVTPDIFRRQFPFKTEFSDDEIKLIIKRYLDQSGLVNYQALHNDVTDRLGNIVGEELPISDHILHDTGLQWSQEDVTAVERIQAMIVERRSRPRDYFKDFDPLRKGYCTVGQARTVFSIMNLNISDADFDILRNLYCRPGDNMFHYDAFQKRVDQAFTTPGLEMLPLARPPMPSPESTFVARKNYVKITAGQEDRITLVEDKVRARVQEIRLQLIDFFKDFDQTHQGHVTNSQFARILTMLQLPISNDEIELLALKYSDRGTTRDVNYKEFCATVDPTSADYILAQKQGFAPYMGQNVPQYFDKNGEVIPAV